MKIRLKSFTNLILILCLDIFLISGAYYFAHLIRFDFSIPGATLGLLFKSLISIVVIKLLIFVFFRLYKGMWRFTSLPDLFNILKASMVGSICLILFFLYFNRFEGFSRSIFIMDWFLSFLFVTASRVAIRIYYEIRPLNWFQLKKTLCRGDRHSIFGDVKNIILIGIDHTAEGLCREIQNNRALNYKVMGFVGINSTKTGKYIHGKPILGDIQDLPQIVEKISVDELVIAVSAASSKEMRDIIRVCQDSGLPHKTVPGVGELIRNGVSVSNLREVSYNDLLGRENVQLDLDLIRSVFCGQIILVTGAAGSIGSELCRQICRFRPKTLVLFDRAESPLHDIFIELQHLFSEINIVPTLADIQYPDQIEAIFAEHKPDIVLHAAAYKHVPMMERYPWKAVKNNIIGSQNVIQSSIDHGVKRFVLVSTDKAVRPTSVMGASKRVTELLALNQKPGSCTKFMAVRFGNVVGSQGSVLPLFKKQIKAGGPLTVTHREITRYFMTIPEAAQLILQAGAMGSGGEIFVLNMGEPVKIDALARDFIRLSGLEPDVDIEIQYIGLRPGEKLYEELITEGEGIIATGHEKIMVLKSKKEDLFALDNGIKKLSGMAYDCQVAQIKKILSVIVPEFYFSS